MHAVRARSSDTPAVTTPTQEPSPTARTAYGVNAAIAWLGIVLTAFFSGLDLYSEPPPEPGLYGNHADGLAGALPRLFDTFSYFTIWSNLVVAISATLLWRRPDGIWAIPAGGPMRTDTTHAAAATFAANRAQGAVRFGVRLFYRLRPMCSALGQLKCRISGT